MTTPSEEEAWRLIVDNYEETAVRENPPAVGPEATPAPEGVASVTPAEPPTDSETSFDAGYFAPPPDEEPDRADRTDEEPTFVPPPAPPAPVVPLGRRVAWAVVAGSPLTFLLAALTGRTIPGTGAGLLALALVGAFVYLVVTMPDEPREPWDDGSRV